MLSQVQRTISFVLPARMSNKCKNLATRGRRRNLLQFQEVSTARGFEHM